MTAIAFEKHLPRLFVEQLPRFADDQPFAVRLPAAVMMTDISGFSALAQEMTREGAQGVESLRELLDAYFGALGAVIARFGGDISTFAGDAVIAVWPDDDDPARAAARAVQCALAIQQEAAPRWRDREITLTQRVAIGHGEVLVCRLGGTDGRWLNVLAGQPVVEAGRACDVTPPGEVMVTAGMASRLGKRLRGVPAAEGLVRAQALEPPQPAAPPLAEALPAGHDDSAWLAPYMPLVLVRRAQAGPGDWLAEFRMVSSMFVKLEQIDFDEPGAGERMQAVTQAIQQVVHRYGGALPYVQMDDKGLNYVIAYGVPAAAYEDDAARALTTALEVQQTLHGIGLRPALGVATGILFCGECGAAHRRQYSMIGPSINFAARLAGAAPDDLLCDEPTTKAAGQRLSFTIAQNVRPKGSVAPVAAFRPERRQRPADGPERLREMVGRDTELEGLAAALAAAAAAGAGARLLVSGEPGIGKSRLLQELRAQARVRGLAVLSGEAQPVERNTPYFLWREPMRALLGLLALPGEPWRDAVRRHLADAPQLLPWAPLLNDLAPLALPETDLTREMRGTARANSMQALLLHLVQRACADAPLALFVDDLHWIDELSGGVLAALAERAPTLSIVAGSRPLQAYPNPAAQEFCRHPALRSTVLGAFGPAQTAEMVGRMLGVAEVPEELARLVHGRCDGNPFYIQQLTLDLREAGHLEIVGGRCLLRGTLADHVAHALPGTLRGVITSRVDRLPEEQQLLLKVASVFGRVFSAAGLAAVHPVPGQGERVAELLAGLTGSKLVTPAPEAGDDGHAFSHALVQEAVYEQLPLAQRRRQHLHIADWLEARHGDALAGLHGVLAGHCLHAEAYPRALVHLEAGAAMAIRQSAYREAIGHIETARRVAEAQRLEPDALRRARWHGLLGDSHHELSEYGQARTNFLQLLELLGEPYAPGPVARAGGILAHLARHAASRWRAAPSLVEAAGEAEDGAKAAPRLASHAYARLGEISYHENQPLAVLHLTLLSVHRAERAGSLPAMTAGYGALAIAFGQAGLAGVARRHARRAIELAETRPADKNSIAYAHLLAMVNASSQCDWPVLDASGPRAAALYAELGDIFRLASVHTLVSTGALQRGRYAEVERTLAATQACVDAGAPARVAAWLAHDRLKLAILRGEVTPAAIDALTRAAAPVESLVDRLMAHGTCASAWLALGDTAAARTAAEPGLDLLLGRAPVAGAGYVNGPLGVIEAQLATPGVDERTLARACAMLRIYTQQVPSMRPRGYFLLAVQAERQGAARRAEALWRRAVAAARAQGMPYDEAAAHQALGERGDGPAAQDELAQAQALFASLGVPAPGLFRPAGSVAGTAVAPTGPQAHPKGVS